MADQEDSDPSLPESIASSTSDASDSHYFEEEFEEDSTIVLAAHSNTHAAIEAEEDKAYDDDSFENEAEANSQLGSGIEERKDEISANGDSLCEYDEDFENEDGDEWSTNMELQDVSESRGPFTVVTLDQELHDQVPDQAVEQVQDMQTSQTDFSQWCNEKFRLIRGTHPIEVKCQSDSYEPAPESLKLQGSAAITKLMKVAMSKRAQTRSGCLSLVRQKPCNALESVCISSTLVEIVQNRCFEAGVSEMYTMQEAERDLADHKEIQWSRETPKKSLSTFCSTKMEDLCGKLATASLESICSKWMPPTSFNKSTDPRGDYGFLSIGVLQAMHEMTEAQHRILTIGSSDGGARGHQYGERKLKMAARVATTKRQLKISARIREQAISVLGGQSA